MKKTNTVEEAMDEFHGTDIYETYGRVKSTRKVKECNLCYATIPAKSSHIFYKFYGNDGDYPTFNICNDCEEHRQNDLTRIKSGEFNEN